MTDDPITAALQQLADHHDQLTQLTELIAGIGDTLREHQAALEKLAEAPDANPDGYRPEPAPTWWKLAAADRAEPIARLQAWVEQIYRPGSPEFGGDSILPRCSCLGGRCLPRYRRLAEPRSDHFRFCFMNICPAALSSCSRHGRALPAGRSPRGVGHLSSGTSHCAAGSPGWSKGDAQRHRVRRRRRP